MYNLDLAAQLWNLNQSRLESTLASILLAAAGNRKEQWLPPELLRAVLGKLDLYEQKGAASAERQRAPLQIADSPRRDNKTTLHGLLCVSEQAFPCLAERHQRPRVP